VEFYSKNKFEKLVHLVGFIIIIYHDARSPERQIDTDSFLTPVILLFRILQHTRLNKICIFQTVRKVQLVYYLRPRQ